MSDHRRTLTAFNEQCAIADFGIRNYGNVICWTNVTGVLLILNEVIPSFGELPQAGKFEAVLKQNGTYARARRTGAG